MPQITVSTDRPEGAVLLSERVTSADFDSEHFRAQLVQRLAWAVDDACVAGPTIHADRDGREPMRAVAGGR